MADTSQPVDVTLTADQRYEITYELARAHASMVVQAERNEAPNQLDPEAAAERAQTWRREARRLEALARAMNFAGIERTLVITLEHAREISARQLSTN